MIIGDETPAPINLDQPDWISSGPNLSCARQRDASGAAGRT